MKSEEISDLIPTDLINEILLRLPAKSIARFRCVSKLWGSMLCGPYFTELFLTRSSARPRLLLGVIQRGTWFFFSSPQPQNPYDKSSIVVAADFHIKFSGYIRQYNCSYASGLLYFPNLEISKKDKDAVLDVICNPLTGQYVILPKLRRYSDLRRYTVLRSFLGFDPIDKQFKVLSMSHPYSGENKYHILTLGTEKMRWRKIECSLTHDPFSEGICINGVLCYLAKYFDDTYEISYVIVCFDVRSEKFKFVEAKFCQIRPFHLMIINYNGKLGVIYLNYASSDSGFPLELCVWVLEDVEKQEWSKYVYSLWDENKVVKHAYTLSVVGMTATGEIVLSMIRTSKPYYIYYFNPERNTLQSVEIQGLEEYVHESGIVFAFVDYVEDLNVNDQLRSNPLHQGLNIIRKRPKRKCRAPSVKNY